MNNLAGMPTLMKRELSGKCKCQPQEFVFFGDGLVLIYVIISIYHSHAKNRTEKLEKL